MQQVGNTKSDHPIRTPTKYRRLLARPRRHSAIRRYVGFGIVR